jgi:3-hydroxyisobutyrate dehydrogenase-like beta-hydroxyacid dehydrogenase
MGYTSRLVNEAGGGDAKYLKLVLNSIVAATAALFGEALAFGCKGGLSNAKMLEVITQYANCASDRSEPFLGYQRRASIR